MGTEGGLNPLFHLFIQTLLFSWRPWLQLNEEVKFLHAFP